jgi:hypothetical protein
MEKQELVLGEKVFFVNNFRPSAGKMESGQPWSQSYDFLNLQLQRQRCSRLERFSK